MFIYTDPKQVLLQFLGTNPPAAAGGHRLLITAVTAALSGQAAARGHQAPHHFCDSSPIRSGCTAMPLGSITCAQQIPVLSQNRCPVYGTTIFTYFY